MRKHKADLLILILTMVLMGVGLLVIYTIGPVRANFLNVTYETDYYSENYFFVRQLVSVVLAVVAFVIFYKIKYEKLRKLAGVLMWGSLGLCLVLAVSQITKLPLARCELGACRWINLAGLSLQPAEFLKFGVALYLAQIAADYRKAGGFLKRDKDLMWKFWGKYVLTVGLSLFFVVVMQKDLGSGLPIAAEALAILLVAGVPMKTFAMIMVATFVLAVGMILAAPHRRERLATYLGMGESATIAGEETNADSYHIENALIAIGSGGLFGVGAGNSVQATGYLPESINDSVFAIMGETFGFVGLLAVLGVFILLLFRILKVADYSVDQEMNLVAVGAFAWLMTHIVVNIMAMTGLVPLTGITLPLLSYGGTSMTCVVGILGLVMQLSTFTGRQVVKDEDRVQGESSIRFNDTYKVQRIGGVANRIDRRRL